MQYMYNTTLDADDSETTHSSLLTNYYDKVG